MSFSALAIDYDVVIPFKHQLLETAWTNFKRGARPDLQVAFDEFRHAEAHWLEDYGLFRALKVKHNGAYYLEWPAELVQRVPAALAQARGELAERIEQVCLAQFLLFRQGERLKEYAHAKGVRLIGDLPFFVSPDSSDVWANPELFLLDDHHRPRFVAGVPPDYFSAEGSSGATPSTTGRSSGGPAIAGASIDCAPCWRTSTQFAWITFVRSLPRGMCRLEHPRPKLGNGYQARAPSSSAQYRRSWAPSPFIAEDLGVITPDVCALRDQFHIPGTRVLQFAFDGNPENPYLPQHYVPNAVAYTGTHDNNTTRGWFEDLADQQRQRVWKYLNRPEGDSREVAPALMEMAWSSAAALAMAPLQDLLNLGSEARMNVPGRAEGNWRWRCTEDMLSAPAFEQLRDLTKTSNRWR